MTDTRARHRDDCLGVVIAGAGTRGAYEIGALSVLIPELRRRGEHVRVVTGTSAGALNAVLVSLMCSDPEPDRAARAALDLWRELTHANVFRALRHSAPRTVTRQLADIVGLPAESVVSLLDTAPLARLLREFPHWTRLHEAVAAGHPRAVAVAATSYVRGRPVLFVETADGRPVPGAGPQTSVDYVRTTIGPEHILASTALPIAFPPAWVSEPPAAAGWYLDGGVRLNTPIAPALALGADRLVIVATHPLHANARAAPPDGPPDVVAVAGQVLHAALVDDMITDVHALARVNRLVSGSTAGGPGEGDAGGGPPGGGDGDAGAGRYRQVPFLVVAPETTTGITHAAHEVLARKYADWPSALAGEDYAVLSRLAGGVDEAAADLFSYLLFDVDFIDRLIALGRRDAKAGIAARGADLWRLSTARA